MCDIEMYDQNGISAWERIEEPVPVTAASFAFENAPKC